MEKNNKLIAEFMGCNHPFNNVTDATLYSVSHGTFEADELKYHTSWDWLMPVIEEIDHLQYESIDNIENALATRSIKNTYNAVVEFIKDYNKYICGSCGDNCNEYTYNEETDVDECNQCKTINQNN